MNICIKARTIWQPFDTCINQGQQREETSCQIRGGTTELSYLLSLDDTIKGQTVTNIQNIKYL